MPTRTDRLHIRLTDAEREALDAAAEQDGESASVIVRRAVREWLLRREGRRLAGAQARERARG